MKKIVYLASDGRQVTAVVSEDGRTSRHCFPASMPREAIRERLLKDQPEEPAGPIHDQPEEPAEPGKEGPRPVSLSRKQMLTALSSAGLSGYSTCNAAEVKIVYDQAVADGKIKE